MPGAEDVFLVSPPAGVAVYQQTEREARTDEQYAFLIACHTVGVGASTQKLNHWTVARLMKEACTPEGVKLAAEAYPNIPLFAGAAQRSEALLSSRLDALEPSAIKPYFSKSLQDLQKLRENLSSEADKKVWKEKENTRRGSSKGHSGTTSGPSGEVFEGREAVHPRGRAQAKRRRRRQ